MLNTSNSKVNVTLATNHTMLTRHATYTKRYIKHAMLIPAALQYNYLHAAILEIYIKLVRYETQLAR